MEFTEELTLIKQTPSQDSIGQVVLTETRKNVLAKRRMLGSKEYYGALAVGIRPTAELLIRISNYDNEQEVEYKGIRYSIIRTLPKDKYDLVLVIGVKEVNG